MSSLGFRYPWRIILNIKWLTHRISTLLYIDCNCSQQALLSIRYDTLNMFSTDYIPTSFHALCIPNWWISLPNRLWDSHSGSIPTSQTEKVEVVEAPSCFFIPSKYVLSCLWWKYKLPTFSFFGVTPDTLFQCLERGPIALPARRELPTCVFYLLKNF